MKRLPARERRRNILDTALTVLADEGYSGLTTAVLARRAGVTEPILYRHFPSKREMLRTLLDEVIDRMISAFRQLSDDEKDPVAALRRICQAYPELARRYRREFSIINRALLEVRDPEIRRLLTRHYAAYRDFLQTLIESGQRAGVLRREIPAALGAWHMIHSALGFLITQDVRQGARSVKDARSFGEIALDSLLKVS